MMPVRGGKRGAGSRRVGHTYRREEVVCDGEDGGAAVHGDVQHAVERSEWRDDEDAEVEPLDTVHGGKAREGRLPVRELQHFERFVPP